MPHMSLPSAGAPLRCLPRTFHGKNGLGVELRRLAADAGQRLIDMYLAFRPRNSFQGLPPLKDEVCVRWVQDMLRDGIHVTAESAEAAMVGHTALFPINRQKCELLVVVCPGFQNLGIGTELVRSCIDLADELGYERIWLPVDATNVRARHVYRKCGFEYVSNGQGRELDMACEVRRHRRPPTTDAKLPHGHVPAPCFRFPDCLSPLPLGEGPGVRA
jgi:RimJ/RimL family protein N-acetyltransferase